MVFLGVALLVYHLFLKLLGIFLMLLEVVWFVIRPVTREIAYLWERRAAVRIAWRPATIVFGALLLLVWILPISSQVTAPAVLRAESEQAVFAPFASQVNSIIVKHGQHVQAGDLLAVLEVPELEARWRQAEVAIASVRAELQRAPASVRQQEQQSVLQEKLAQGLAEQQAVREEAQRLELRASGAGTVQDMAPDLVEGRWVNSRQLLMRVVSESERMIEMYVSESQVEAIKPGQDVSFFPAVPKVPVMKGTVIAVDKTPSRQIHRPLLASTFGGDLAAVSDPKEGLIAYDATFRVLIKPAPGTLDSPAFVLRGTARVQTDLRFIAENIASRFISILIRESGF
jgi:putative peptide zinc metalloprotease protein